MDHAQGAIRADEHGCYTIGFGADATASMRLDFNRGRSLFEAEGTGPGQGSLVSLQIAATMASCPPEPLDERLGQRLGFMRSHVIRGDRLTMALMADCGLPVWERAENGEP